MDSPVEPHTPAAPAIPVPSRWRTFRTATLFGLAWFPLIFLAFLIGNTIAGTLLFHTRQPTPAQLQVFQECTDFAMLILSGVFCLLMAPVLLKIKWQNYRQFLQDLGVLGGSWQAILALGSLLILVAVLIPLMTPASFWHKDALSWVTLAQPPLVEETLFRGIVLALLLKRFPAWFAVLWAAVLFMPPHVFEGLVMMLTNGLAFGVTQGLLRLRTRSIWPGVVAHYFAVSGLGSPVFFAYVLVLAVLLGEWGLRALLGSTTHQGSALIE